MDEQIPPSSPKRRKPPRWTIAFLRALERCGQARASAEAAGVDHTTAYARREAHADFAAAWVAALAAYKENVRRAEEDEGSRGLIVPGAPSTIESPFDGPPPRSGEELTVSNGQLKRAGPGRWSKKKERIFLAELHASGNISRAARAIAMSEQAISARRRNEPRLDQACEAAVAAAKKRLHAMVVASGTETFDPRDLPDADESPLPKVTIREAIDILKLPVPGGAKAQPAEEPYDMDEIRARIEKKMRVLGMLDGEAKQAARWSRDERHNCWVPPGWIQGPEYEPGTGED